MKVKETLSMAKGFTTSFNLGILGVIIGFAIFSINTKDTRKFTTREIK